jgi:hypothetical protein
MPHHVPGDRERGFKRTDLRDFEIAAINGHKTMKMLKRYARLWAGELAERLV